MTAQIRILVVDDQIIVRQGIAMMLDAEEDMLVVGTAGDGLGAIDLAAQQRPDVILMDVRMPKLDGISATREILRAGTAGAVVIVTTFDDEEYLLDGIRAGAAGFLLKDAGAELLAAAVRSARSGDALIDPQMTRVLLRDRLEAKPAPVDDRITALSDREREILDAVARGQSNAAIATFLWLSEATVKSHISNILGKLKLSNRVQLAVLAYESGFVRPGWLSADGAEPREE